MSRDRTTWIAVSLATIGLILSIYWGQQDAARVRAQAEAQQALASAHASAMPTANASPTPNVAETKPATPATPEQTGSLKSPVAVFQFSYTRGGLDNIILPRPKAERRTAVRLNNHDGPAGWPLNPHSNTLSIYRTTALRRRR